MSDEHQISFIGRVKESFHDSFGEIVFGMSDGTVSIFGLVAGMVAGAQSGDVIVLAGATAAIAATVSMMAGVFLDLESERDCARVEAEQRAAEIKKDPEGAVTKLIGDLQTTGLVQQAWMRSVRFPEKSPCNPEIRGCGCCRRSVGGLESIGLCPCRLDGDCRLYRGNDSGDPVCVPAA